MTTIGYDDGPKRGTANEVKNSGTALAAILKTGAWLSAPYRNYLDLQADEAVNISTLHLGSLSSDSEDEGPIRPLKRPTDKTVTKRVRKVPIAFVNKLDQISKKRKKKNNINNGLEETDSDTSSSF